MRVGSLGATMIMLGLLSAMCRTRDPDGGDGAQAGAGAANDGDAARSDGQTSNGDLPGGTGGTAHRTGTAGANAGDATGDGGQRTHTGGTGGQHERTAGAGGMEPGAGGVASEDAGGSDDAPGTGGSHSDGGQGGTQSGAGGSTGAMAGTGPSGGAAASCGKKTGCCAPEDPPCLEGCPQNGADYCCDKNLGARITCKASDGFGDVVCLDCDGRSFGTGSCTACTDPTDKLCDDDTWDAPCKAGGSAFCSNPAEGYRAQCSGVGGGQYLSGLYCTCDAGPADECKPTPCCGPTSPSCANGCDPDVGSCCDEGQYLEVCNVIEDAPGSEQFACIDDCTGHAFGLNSCHDSCLFPSDPPCDDHFDWAANCNEGGLVYCSDPLLGYRRSCQATLGKNNFKNITVKVECTCNPG